MQPDSPRWALNSLLRNYYSVYRFQLSFLYKVNFMVAMSFHFLAMGMAYSWTSVSTQWMKWKNTVLWQLGATRGQHRHIERVFASIYLQAEHFLFNSLVVSSLIYNNFSGWVVTVERFLRDMSWLRDRKKSRRYILLLLFSPQFANWLFTNAIGSMLAVSQISY